MMLMQRPTSALLVATINVSFIVPVLSWPTVTTSNCRNQSSRASKSAVMVEKVRTRRCMVPSGSVINTQATTDFLCTSSPQQRV